MGKLTLLFVMVAVLGGSLLTFSTRQRANESDNERRDVQGDLLARDAAASGHGLVLNAMIGTEGFQPSLGFVEQDVRDGRFTVDDYSPAPDGQSVELTVSGHSGGATHTIRSRYEWDPMDFPGPIWLDVPYATADINPDAVIDGGPDALPTHFDDRRYHELNLNGLLPWNTMENALASALDAAGGAGGAFMDSDMHASGFLDDLNVADATDLYYAGTNAMGAGDVTIIGPHVYSGTTQNFGATPRIVRVTGSLTIDDASVAGAGLLIVEGPITMTGNAPSLSWNGIVLIHSEEDYLPIEMGGDATVDIDGAFAIDHLAMPPGGHMDVTVMRGNNHGSWGGPDGIDSPVWPAAYPWYQHKHRFDIDLPEARTVYFVEEGGDRHEEWTQFRDFLNDFGSTPIYLEFDNENNHGYATFTLDVDGAPEVYTGAIKNGFGAFSASGNVFRTQVFNADDLNTFIVDVQSLRSLRKRWDEVGGCEVWPICIGNSWNRKGALTVRVRRASSNRKLYEAALYWHMRPDEVLEHQAEEAALRAQIESGALFGTNLALGPNVRIDFDLEAIEAVGTRLGFDGDEVINVGTWTTHMSARDYRAQGIDVGVGGGPMGAHPATGAPTAPVPMEPVPPPESWLITLCHKSGGSNLTIDVTAAEATVHLGHGDDMGACLGLGL